MVSVNEYVETIHEISNNCEEEESKKKLGTPIKTVTKKDFGPGLEYIKEIVSRNGTMIVNSTFIEFVGDSYDC